MYRLPATLLSLSFTLCCALLLTLLTTQAQTQTPIQPQTSLPQLIATVLATHPAVQGQRAQLQGAQAGVDSARWQYYPTPSGPARLTGG